MPLDMRTTCLTDVAGWHGVTPVPLEVLEAHKIAELKKRRFYRLLPIVCNLALISMPILFCGAVIAFGAGNHEMLLMLSAGFMSCIITVLYLFGIDSTTNRAGFYVYGPAEWTERQVALHEVQAPESIKAIASRIMEDDYGDMRLVVGELTQHYVVVDPYLVIERGDERIVIGIWDDDGIVQQATV